MSKKARKSFVRVVVVACALAAASVAPSGALAAPGGYSQADVDRAIQRGVDWLSTQQRPDGSFDSDSGFPEAETGLAIVSYGVLANGDLSFSTVPNASDADRARWRGDLGRAVDYLLSKQNANGS
jgi:squalene cyclase